jgi:hypothetical protein
VLSTNHQIVGQTAMEDDLIALLGRDAARIVIRGASDETGSELSPPRLGRPAFCSGSVSAAAWVIAMKRLASN